tara:strand:+ start:1214 stop:2605 length:1392 start_codon:yes stop_codon:yes gene_type:complete
MKRKLLAVVAADMVGFSRLVENDEINILSRQKEYFNEIIEPEIKKFHGEIIKTTGDGFLATFVSSLDAVESTTNIQKIINFREKTQSNDKRIWYRIGINIGDVVLDDGDIFGNSVNIASRLESIADAGDVCITSEIFQNIKNLKSFDISHLGEQHLKNISQKVDVYKIKINHEEHNQNKENELLTEANQEIRYCSSKDNTIIAYAKLGNGPPLLKAPNFMSSLEHDWRSPIWMHLYRFLAEGNTLVRFDQRGNGSSDLEPLEITFNSFVEDMEAVVNESKIDKFPILGVSQGCAVSIAYAIRNPNKVSHLILIGGFARGKGQRGDPSYEEKSKMEQTMILSGWEDENPAFRQYFTTSMIPEGSKEQMDSFNNIMKITTSAKNAAKISSVNDQIDVSDILLKLEVPTLIFHCTDDARVPISEGKFMAANIKNSKFIPIKSKNHVLLETEQGWGLFKEEVTKFLN